MMTKKSKTRGAVIVATDLSTESGAALTAADAWADHLGAPLIVCHTLPRQDGIRPLLPHLFSVTEERAQLDAAGDAVAAQVHRHTGREEDDFTIALDFGSAHAVIVELAERHEAAVVILASHDKGSIERLLSGSTSDQVVRHAPCPVCVYRPSGSGPVVAAMDLSERSVPALASAAAEATRRGTKLVAVHAIEVASRLLRTFEPTSSLDDKALEIARGAATQLIQAHVDEVGCEAEIRVVIGGAVDSVRATAEQVGASLIVVASHGHSALKRFAIGSVAEAIVRHAPCSVLVARYAP